MNTDAPIRRSLSEQIAADLRRRLEHREWALALPGERALSKQLAVSRSTLRAALRMIEREGWIRTDTKRARRILRHGPRKHTKPLRVVFLKAGTQWGDGGWPAGPPPLNEAASILADRGLECTFVHQVALDGDDPGTMLDALARRYNARCWILCSIPGPAQRWFAERGLPAIVYGSLFGALSMPHLDLDHRAVCRHAVGMLMRRGHRRIGFLTCRTLRAGDVAAEEGYREALTLADHPALEPMVIRTSLDPLALCKALDEAFASNAPPTALLTSAGHLTLTAVTHCLHRGKRIPADLSIVARDAFDALGYVQPSITRYEFNKHAYALKLCRMVQRLVRTGHVPTRGHLVVPTLLNGDSVGPPPRG